MFMEVPPDGWKPEFPASGLAKLTPSSADCDWHTSRCNQRDLADSSGPRRSRSGDRDHNGWGALLLRWLHAAKPHVNAGAVGGTACPTARVGTRGALIAAAGPSASF